LHFFSSAAAYRVAKTQFARSRLCVLYACFITVNKTATVLDDKSATPKRLGLAKSRNYSQTFA
jgi:hypothetical protein